MNESVTGSLRTSQSWKRVSRRIRVPLGFLFVIFYFWLARPTPMSVAVSLVLVAPGLFLRGYASGCVRKNAELATTGPYAYTRNPLYLGSILIAFGFAVAAYNPWIVLALVVLFLAIYWPVILGEEDYLREHFPGYAEYAARVPRILPRCRVPRDDRAGSFSRELYGRHHEYNALIGALCVYLGLILRILIGNAG